jgi:hypothetical protein
VLSLPTTLNFKKSRQRVGRGFHETDSIAKLLVLLDNEVTEGEAIFTVQLTFRCARRSSANDKAIVFRSALIFPTVLCLSRCHSVFPDCDYRLYGHRHRRSPFHAMTITNLCLYCTHPQQRIKTPANLCYWRRATTLRSDQIRCREPQ